MPIGLRVIAVTSVWNTGAGSESLRLRLTSSIA